MKYTRAGFTIVELLIVIVVIAILAAITIVSFNGIQKRALVSVAQQDLRNIATVLDVYVTENGRLPEVPSGTAVAALELESIVRQSGLFNATRQVNTVRSKSFLFCQSSPRDRIIVIAVEPVVSNLADRKLAGWADTELHYYDTSARTIGVEAAQDLGLSNTGATFCQSVSGEAGWFTRWAHDIPVKEEV